MTLLESLKSLPDSSGIYQYFDNKNKLLYIGKAKSLRNRVKSYFKFTPILGPADKLSPRINKMICEVSSLQYIIVPTEHDALILENSLIKQLKPKYNVLLRDDKTFPYIYIDLDQSFPRFEITRKVIIGKSIKYFGPFSIGANEILKSVYELIPLVQKKSCISGKKACMFYQIGKCKAPCENKITQKQYAELIKQAIDLISNKHKILPLLKDKIARLAQELRFEEAKDLRDDIDKIQRSQISTTLDFANLDNIDVLAVHKDFNRAICVQMFIRNGKLISSSHKLFKDDFDIDEEEIFERTIANYYKESLPNIPHSLLVSHNLKNKELLEDFIKTNCGKKVQINNPQIGKKREIVQIALQNCIELLRIENLSNKNNIEEKLKELCEFSKTPRRIEIFDNSHMMGQAKVGAMVVWENGFKKESYRHFNLTSNDEYHQMQELLTRRALKFDELPAPDLWIIDGGQTLLNLAQDIITSSGANIDLMAISKEKRDAKAQRAKCKAKDILHILSNSLKLEENDERLQFVQKLRDEAHRFAITFHKKQKRSEDKQISLLSINGFGEAKIKKLLQFFGTFENIKNASTEELKAVLNEKDATLLINFFEGTNIGNNQTK